MLYFEILFLFVILIVSTIADLRSHKIPNWLTFPSMIVGISFYTIFKGSEGFFFSIEGVGVGIAVFMIPYLFGGTGAGDVKLMGAVGGFLGPKGVFIAFLFTSIVGGIYALILLIYHGYFRDIIKRYGSMFKALILTKRFIYLPSSCKKGKPKLCYGVAIALGTIISVAISIAIKTKL
jgi:prepilin peptidase CpaA